MLKVFDEHLGVALGKAWEENSDSYAVVLAHTAQIIHRQMFADSKLFNGSFEEKFQQESVPKLLPTLVNMF